MKISREILHLPEGDKRTDVTIFDQRDNDELKKNLWWLEIVMW